MRLAHDCDVERKERWPPCLRIIIHEHTPNDGRSKLQPQSLSGALPLGVRYILSL